MFRASSCPSSGATTTAVAASGLRSELGDSSTVGKFVVHKPKNWNSVFTVLIQKVFNPLNPELNPICYLLALLGAHHFLHVSRKGLNY